MSRLVQRLVVEKGVRNRTVVEVGCGKGHFLRKLIAEESAGNRGLGFDPAYVGPESEWNGRLTFHRTFYDARCASIPADVVICRHVIEHLTRPLELLAAVHAALTRATHGRVFFETPCVEWILRHQVTWDFFYEHCSLFTASSLATAFQRAAYRVGSVEHVFGGQYLWLEAQPSKVAAVLDRRGKQQVLNLAGRFQECEQRRLHMWSRRLRTLAESGKTAIWGAGAKGVTFANLVDPDCRFVRCVVDVNPNKQGKYLAGTGHAIVAPQDLADLGIRSALVLNPNYCSEVSMAAQQLGLKLDVVDLMSERTVAA